MGDLVGVDLEYIVQADVGYIPAGFLPIQGTKGNPERYPTGGVEIDCCAVELTMDPADNEDQFASTILKHLEAMNKRYEDYGKLVAVPSHTFDELAIRAAPHATTMGCSPDMNVWTMKQNPRPVAKKGFRTFGGHLHIEKGTPQTIKACDLTLGMWSVIADPDKKRRSLYGKAGAFRPKPYGVEYRVLSNFWCGDETLIRKVWRLVETAKEIAPEVDDLVAAVGGPKKIQQIINKSLMEDAKAVLASIGVQ